MPKAPLWVTAHRLAAHSRHTGLHCLDLFTMTEFLLRHLGLIDLPGGVDSPAGHLASGLPDDGGGYDERSSLSGLLTRPQTLVGAAAFFIAALIAVLFFLFSGGDPNDEERVGSKEAAEESIEDDALAARQARSAYSVDGILTALRTQGWRIDEFREPIDLNHYRYRRVTIYQGGVRLDLTLFETLDDAVLQELQDQITPPEESIVFDHIFLRITPRQDDDYYAMERVRQFLEEFRDLVHDL